MGSLLTQSQFQEEVIARLEQLGLMVVNDERCQDHSVVIPVPNRPGEWVHLVEAQTGGNPLPCYVASHETPGTFGNYLVLDPLDTGSTLVELITKIAPQLRLLLSVEGDQSRDQKI